jgi:hypothetical protein
MKIYLLKNNVTDETTLETGIVLAQQYALTIGLDLEFTEKVTDTVFSTYSYTGQNVGETATVNSQEILNETPIGYDIGLLVYDWTKVTGVQPKNPSDAQEIINGVNPMAIPIQWYALYPDTFATFFLHELCHMESFKNKKNDITHLLTDGTLQSELSVLYNQFNRKQPKDWYLFLLNSLINVPNEGNLPPDDPSHLFNTQTGALNPSYTTLQAPQTNETVPVVSETIPEIITRICIANDVEPELGLAVAECESGLNPKATLYNPPSNSTDRGLYQWNSKYHSEISDADSFDPEKATEYFCQAVKSGKLVAYWSASEKCWSTKLSPEIKKKYNI